MDLVYIFNPITVAHSLQLYISIFIISGHVTSDID